MFKLKQVALISTMGIALIIGSDAMAKTPSIPKCTIKQWVNGKKCSNCPPNAKCNGMTFSCNKNFTQKANKCIPNVNANIDCPKGYVPSSLEFSHGRLKCLACPAGATCSANLTETGLSVRAICKNGATAKVYADRIECR